MVVDNAYLTAFSKYGGDTFLVYDSTDTGKDGVAGILGEVIGLFNLTGSGTPDVERTHGKLGSGFADGLRRYGADGFTDVDEVSARKVASVAFCTNTAFSLTGEGGTDSYGRNADFFEFIADFLGYKGVFRVNKFTGCRVVNRVKQGSA